MTEDHERLPNPDSHRPRAAAETAQVLSNKERLRRMLAEAKERFDKKLEHLVKKDIDIYPLF